MRVPEQLNLPAAKEGVPYLQQLVAKLTTAWANMAAQVNATSEGTIYGATNALAAAPTTGDHQRGDIVRNSAPAELGTAGSKYVVIGWQCVAAGTPGTWVQLRCLTGN
ncbi:hypothetical protein [Cupriavidus campinensis]|uniref:Chitin-binding type-3 domain-containing protein n=1 Tax=Cupriavidus campinensis TaxID=151783 RepID=A0ABY3EKF8_9BURK|nr:hypothetical protein [Cupriavidus campinensis]TSP11437.1 hypothetical protein FGG12_17520 [Cupriavidus campinensis]